MGSSWYEYTQNFDVLESSGAVWPVSALAFDQQSELLYAGDIGGRVTAYMLGGPNEELEKQAICVCSHSPIRQLHGLQNSVLVRSDDSVQLRTSGGFKVYGKTTSANDVFTGSAVNQHTQNEFITCTTSGGAAVVTLGQGTIMKRFTMELSTTAMDYKSQALTLATMTGTLAVRDPRAAFKVTQAVSAYSGPVSDIALHDHTLFACGMSMDASTSYEMVPGSTIKVYDVRKLTAAVDEIVCEGVPSKLQVTGGDLWVCYDSGYAESRPLSNVIEPSVDFIEPVLSEYAYMSGFSVSPTESVAVVSDTDGMVHVWANKSNIIMSNGGEVPPTVMSEEQHARAYTTCGIDIDNELVPLSYVYMPEYTEPLLSRFSVDTLYDVGRPCSYVDPNILGNLKHMDGVGYAPNPRTTKRNQQPYGMGWRRRWREGVTDDDELTQGRSKFISVQRRCGMGRETAEYIQQQQQVSSPVPAAAAPPLLNGGRTASFDTVSRSSPAPSSSGVAGKVPTHLQQMRIEYSRFGVEDFDFSLYNATRWGGLEGNITNSYANALLQVLFFMPELREIALSHCATDCPEPLCLTCQLGLLFRMLETAEGASCHATHLLHVIQQRPEAVALALLEDAHGNPTDGVSYSVLTQRLLRFVLEQANNECAALGITGQGPGMSKRVVEAIVGFPQATQTTCPVCSSQQSRDSHVFAVDLDSPYGSADLATLLAGGSASVKRAELGRRKSRQGVAELIEQALSKTETTRAWCAQCKKFQLLQTEKYMTRVPSGYLAVNFSAIDAPSTGAVPMNSAPAPMASAGGGNAGAEPWRFTLPMRLDLTVTSDKSARVKVGENREGNFELVAVVSSIRDTARGPEHLVAHVRDPDSPDGWLLFNDFLVQPAAQAAVTGLGDAWRAPSFAMYANTSRAPLANAVNLIKRRFPYRISTRILTQPASSLDKPASNRRSSARGTQKRNGAVPLTKDEAAQLGPGFQYAFDAEFVVLEEAKTEVFSDGTQEMHRPPIHQLARLSLVRATPGPMYGVPFVDDYVATTTPIADLATAYSGIHEGDLVPGVSRFKLSTLKEAYKKLRLLVDAGCVVIGHGLKHDFRVIDIVVPMPQRRDTMVLFQSRTHMRPIALKFLYWFLCHKTIQAGEHSSVEDAQATLSVYEKYKECVEADPEDGCENLLDSIYDMGAQVAWKVPE